MKMLGRVLGVVALLAVTAAAFLFLKKPAQRAPLPGEFERTPARLVRGEYLVRHVADCLGCHSDFAMDVYSMPPKPGTEGAGGFCFTKENAGFPGVVCAQNITPDVETGIGAWTDGEILRAIREGVSKDGHALFPMMPYSLFRNLSDEDGMAIVAYLRSLPPIRHQVQGGQLDFPLNVIVKFIPHPLDGVVSEPNHKDQLAYGKYLAWACYECHTPVDGHMKPIPGKDFSGGREFHVSGLNVASANLTFDATGLASRSEGAFIAQFKAFTQPGAFPKVAIADNTLMPWYAYAGMAPEDLSAIYAYLKTLPPIVNAKPRRLSR